ncbi:putative reverse transcriptase domain, aspartic peptidase domain protein [Tanacetum coccineum]
MLYSLQPFRETVDACSTDSRRRFLRRIRLVLRGGNLHPVQSLFILGLSAINKRNIRSRRQSSPCLMMRIGFHMDEIFDVDGLVRAGEELSLGMIIEEESTVRVMNRTEFDRQGSDRQSGGSNYRNNNNSNHSRDNNRSNLNRYRLYLLYDMNLTSRHGNRNSGAGRDQRNKGYQQSRVPLVGNTHPVCNTCRRRHPGECRRAAGTCFKCGQAGHLQRDCKKKQWCCSLVMLTKKTRRIRPCLFALTLGSGQLL